MKNSAIRNSVLVSAVLLLLTGCTSTVFQDFTPARIPQNPSGIYTFSFTGRIPTSNRIAGSERAQIVINNETYDMVRVRPDELTFTFDYKIPPGINEVRYYYVLSWDYNLGPKVRTATRYSTAETGKVFQSVLINRYPIQLVNDRGPAGAAIPIVGTGFTAQDVVVVGSTEALTTVHSPNSLEFIVPAIPANQTYRVVVRTGSGDLVAGNFRVDEAALRVQPRALSLRRGQTDFLIIELDNPAPLGGLLIDARTDVPRSVIMAEIVVPEGARSVNVNVTGGEPGAGVLVLTVPGYAPVRIPVSVN